MQSSMTCTPQKIQHRSQNKTLSSTFNVRNEGGVGEGPRQIADIGLTACRQKHKGNNFTKPRGEGRRDRGL